MSPRQMSNKLFKKEIRNILSLSLSLSLSLFLLRKLSRLAIDLAAQIRGGSAGPSANFELQIASQRQRYRQR